MVAAQWSTSPSPLETTMSTSPSGGGLSQVRRGGGVPEGSRMPTRWEANRKGVGYADSSLGQEGHKPSQQGGRRAGRHGR